MRIAAGTSLRAKALLFDFDGTLVDSMALIDELWTGWGRRHGVAAEDILAVCHGRRMSETIAHFATPEMDQAAEGRALIAEIFGRRDGLFAIAGADALLRSLPADRWAIVTSSFRDLVPRWLDAVSLPHPKIMVTTEDVTRGKPAPDCFLLAARRLGVEASETVVFEDAHAGFEGARAAGARVVALATTHPPEKIEPETWIRDYRSVMVDGPDPAGWLTLRFG